MVDFAIDFWKRLNPDQEVPQEFLDKRQKVLAKLRELEQATSPVIALITKEEVSQEIAKTRDVRQLLEYLQKNHGVSLNTPSNLGLTLTCFVLFCLLYSLRLVWLMF